MNRLGRGDWSPASTHPTLLAVQLVALWQAAVRGLDYLDGIAGGLDRGAADPAYGLLLYASAALVLLGLALRRGGPVILGHALVASWYAGLGFSTLAAAGTREPIYVTGGALLSAAGVLLLLRAPTWHGRLFAVPAMLAGQALLVDGLGPDPRAGTGLLSAALLHLVLAVGTFVLWQRDRLRRVVDAT